MVNIVKDINSRFFGIASSGASAYSKILDTQINAVDPVAISLGILQQKTIGKAAAGMLGAINVVLPPIGMGLFAGAISNALFSERYLQAIGKMMFAMVVFFAVPALVGVVSGVMSIWSVAKSTAITVIIASGGVIIAALIKKMLFWF